MLPHRLLKPALVEMNEQGEEDKEFLPPRLQRHCKQFREYAPKPRTLPAAVRGWKRMLKVRRCERHNVRRLAIFDELVALQTLKQKAETIRPVNLAGQIASQAANVQTS